MHNPWYSASTRSPHCGRANRIVNHTLIKERIHRISGPVMRSFFVFSLPREAGQKQNHQLATGGRYFTCDSEVRDSI